MHDRDCKYEILSPHFLKSCTTIFHQTYYVKFHYLLIGSEKSLCHYNHGKLLILAIHFFHESVVKEVRREMTRMKHN